MERFNHSPAGRYEGIVLKSGDKLVQVNFPRPMAMAVTQAVATGDQISVVGVAEETKGDHPVHRLQTGRMTFLGKAATRRRIAASQHYLMQ